ncbi:MAG: 30S ribosomal protein S4 [Firmicutes bacterium]|uniref:Small ribosomal subunit protein uS4 n=1 Tax=Candidatus Scatoplasma merdavium TaxID=2840932 RepID=A0A9D9GR18_9BACL|nr:30S ribosomal protein S4 [Candidatus Scatoplasma merdavium]
MSRYVGPTWKLSRRLGYSILENGKELAKRNYAPGQHGKDRRSKQSEYGKQLTEKQKLRLTYGVSERQFRRLFLLAKAEKEVTGIAFMRILESRLDNLVYRLGFARTRRQARQLVTHGHVLVDGKKVDIPSYLVKVGSHISLSEKASKFAIVEDAIKAQVSMVPYVSCEKEKHEGIFVRTPERSELPRDINEAQIVEYYNRKL